MTELTDFQRKTEEIYPGISLRFWEPLEKHTSFRIGGPAEVMAFPKNSGELGQLLNKSVLLDCKPVILGAGTNVLAPDEGLRGLVICLKDCLDGLARVDETHIRAMAGVTMTRLAMFAAREGLSGLEFAHGIPGSVGGGLYMNAGAYGGEIRQVAVRTEFLDQEGIHHTLEGEEQGFGYRKSAFMGTKRIITSAELCLESGAEAEITAKMEDFMRRRREKQPLELPSAGSVFKRPEGYFAGTLIEQCGLKGFAVGGACVSEKHAGFIVNKGGATCADVEALIRAIQDTVFQATGVELEPEIRRISLSK